MPMLAIIIDGNSLMHRAFHALPEMTSPNGEPVNAIYGFMSMLMKLIHEHSPTHIAVAFDRHKPTRRHIQFPEYKAGRLKTPDELRSQFTLVEDSLKRMGIAVLAKETLEADDILGAASKAFTSRGVPVILVTGDKDSFQLIDDNVRVLFTKRGVSETILLDRNTLRSEYGMYPERVTHVKSLMGDKSDNIPGIAGIGEKTALSLVDKYGTLDEILSHAGDEKGKLKERLESGADSARLSLSLATIDTDAEIDINMEETAASDIRNASDVFMSLGFKSLAARLGNAAHNDNDTPATRDDTQTKRERETVTIDTLEALEAFAARLTQAAPKPLAFHEASDCVSFADDKTLWRIPVTENLLSTGLVYDKVRETIEPIIADTRNIIFMNAKPYILKDKAFKAFGDLSLASNIIDPTAKQEDISAKIAADAIYDTHENQLKLIRVTDALPLYEVELALTPVLRCMESVGFLIDRHELARIGDKLRQSEKELHAEIMAKLGVAPFNLASPKALSKVLFEDLRLPGGKKTKTGYSTDAETLNALADDHPAVAGIVEWRQIMKLLGTYVDGFMDKIGADGRVHTTFFQTAAITGRISSGEPNLQNIPTRTEQGKEIRRAFVAPEGCVLVDADYSQIELRILAHLSGDETMIDAFRNGEDIHARMAAEIYGVPLADVTKAMRSAAKAVNFGIAYGQTDYGLARQLGLSRKDAEAMIGRYFARYPKVKEYLDGSVEQGKRLGYSTTLFGRRRPLPELRAQNRTTRAFGERAAMNTPVQGSAADIMKMAMVKVADMLRGLEARLILQVHDELIVECPIAEEGRVRDILVDGMQSVANLRVPLTVEAASGASWYECK